MTEQQLIAAGFVKGANGEWSKPKLRRGSPPFVGFCEGHEAWTEKDDAALRNYYETTPDAIFSIAVIARQLGRTFAATALRASRTGLSRPRNEPRSFSDTHIANSITAQKKRASEHPGKLFNIAEYMAGKPNGFKGESHVEKCRNAISERAKEWHKSHPHPRGMLGKTHTEATREAISKAHKGKVVPRERVERQMKTRLAKYGTLSPRVHRGTSWKAGWVEIGGQRFYARSLWEANYARYLEWQKQRGEIKSWEHEPTTFWFKGVKRGCVSYLPDFKVATHDGTQEYHEVKGWMDAASKTKIRRMAKYFPTVKLIVIDSSRYKSLAKTCRNIVPGWVAKSKHQYDA
jgi:uncharacterized protein DUF1064/NUMOD3 motif-containing protein